MTIEIDYTLGDRSGYVRYHQVRELQNRITELERKQGTHEVSDQRAIINSLLMRLNNHLVDMKPEWDDSILGFNRAMNIVRDALTNPVVLTPRQSSAHEVNEYPSCDAAEQSYDNSSSQSQIHAPQCTAPAAQGFTPTQLEQIREAIIALYCYAHGNNISASEFAGNILARLAPKKSPQERVEAILTKHFHHIGVVDCAAEIVAELEKEAKQ